MKEFLMNRLYNFFYFEVYWITEVVFHERKLILYRFILKFYVLILVVKLHQTLVFNFLQSFLIQ